MIDNNTFFDAAAAINDLLGDDDGKMLAAMARYKTSIVALFGHAGIVEIMREAIDNAPHIDYFSKRSRREINIDRPEVNLYVDYKAAFAESAAMRELMHCPTKDAKDYNFLQYSEKDILRLTAFVIHEQVCMPIMDTLLKALEPHWLKAKVVYNNLRVEAQKLPENKDKEFKDLKMLISTLFSVRIANDSARADRQLSLFKILL